MRAPTKKDGPTETVSDRPPVLFIIGSSRESDVGGTHSDSTFSDVRRRNAITAIATIATMAISLVRFMYRPTLWDQIKPCLDRALGIGAALCTPSVSGRFVVE